MVDFERKAPGPHIVERIEYDPGRTAHIALVRPKTGGDASYILSPEGMRAGEVIESYRSGIPKHLLESMGGSMDLGVLASKTAWRGNCMPLMMVPVGTLIFNIGLRKNKGGQLCRGAGTYGILLAKAGETPKALPPMRSGKKQKSDEGAVKSNEESDVNDSASTSANIATENSPESNANSAVENGANGPTENSTESNANSVAENSGGNGINAASENSPQGEINTAVEQQAGSEVVAAQQSEPGMTVAEWRRLKKLSEHVTIRLSSGEVRLIHKECCGTVGVASNSDHRYAQLGKAGRSRWKNIRPTVRGLAMNAMDHPHGGGRGKSKGNVPSKSPWGMPVSFLLLWYLFIY